MSTRVGGVAVQNVERSRTSKVSGSCQKVSGSWRRLARRYGPRLASLECISGPGCRSTSFWVLFVDFLHAWQRLTSTVTSVNMVIAELTYEWTMHIIVYVNLIIYWCASFLAIIINKHNKTSQSSLLVIFYKECFLNVLVSERCACYGFVTAMVFNAVYSAASSWHITLAV